MTECEMGGARNRTLVIICIGGMCTMPLAGSIGRTGTPIRLQTQTFRMMVMGKNRHGQHQDAGYQQAVCLKDTSQFRFVLISAKIGHIGQTDKRIGKNRHKKLRNRWKLSDVERFSPASGASLFCFAKKNSILPVAPGYDRQVLSGESPSPVSGRISA